MVQYPRFRRGKESHSQFRSQPYQTTEKATGHGLRQLRPAITIRSMTHRLRTLLLPRWWIAASCCLCLSVATARPSDESRPSPSPHSALPKSSGQDDALILHAPKDLALKPEGERKVRALLDYIQALDLQENGESEKALEAFERVLNIDPGGIDLATPGGFLLKHHGH